MNDQQIQGDHDEPSVFTAVNMMREARRQRGLGDRPVPQVCLLDPDGDVVRHLRAAGTAKPHPDWACFHSELWVTQLGRREIGVVPCAVGAPYAVLVAEQLVGSGCDLVISVTSAGTIIPLGEPPHFVLIAAALRGDGTSGRYLPEAPWVEMDEELQRRLDGAFSEVGEPVRTGRSWTTDAPFRETESAIAAARSAGVHAVEMEAAGLYAFARATRHDVVCIAHVTNSMAVDGDDFDKGEADGTHRILSLVEAIADRLRPATD